MNGEGFAYFHWWNENMKVLHSDIYVMPICPSCLLTWNDKQRDFQTYCSWRSR